MSVPVSAPRGKGDALAKTTRRRKLGTSGQKEDSKYNEVCIHRPLQVIDAGLERYAYLRECDIEDRAVQLNDCKPEALTVKHGRCRRTPHAGKLILMAKPSRSR
jgi:hypothetical protein